MLRLEVLGCSCSLVCGSPSGIWAIMAPGVVEAGSAKIDRIPGSRGASRSLELRQLLSHQGLLEQAGAQVG